MGNNKDVKEKEKRVSSKPAKAKVESLSKPRGGGAVIVVNKDKKHVKDLKEKSLSKPKVSGGAVVVYGEKISKHVKVDPVHYKYEYQSVRNEKQVVMQRGEDVIVQSKVRERHREKVTITKEAAQFTKHEVRVKVKAVPSLLAPGNHRLLLN